MSPRGRSKPAAHGSIAELLRRMRDDAGITSGAAAGDLIGVTQATVSRWENGRQAPSPEQADRYARALRAPATVRRQLVAMVHDLHDQHRAAAPARVAVSRSADHEKRVRRNEERVTHISVFHPVVVPGLLQTEDYIRAIFASAGLSEGATEARITERMARAGILTQPERRFTFVLTAGALGWCVGSPETMITQCRHLVEVSRPPHIDVGVIRWGVLATAFPPYGFDIYDRLSVAAGVVGGTTYYDNLADVNRHIKMLQELRRMAVWGDEARAELQRVADEYRSLT